MRKYGWDVWVSGHKLMFMFGKLNAIRFLHFVIFCPWINWALYQKVDIRRVLTFTNGGLSI